MLHNRIYIQNKLQYAVVHNLLQFTTTICSSELVGMYDMLISIAEYRLLDRQLIYREELVIFNGNVSFC